MNNNYSIIKRVVRKAPRGNVLTPCWLNQHGVSRKLAWWYAYSGWLNHLGSGAYTLIGDQVTWAGALRAVQHQLNKPLHVGGKSALELLGRAHYLRFEQQDIELFASQNTVVPSWLETVDWGVTFSLFKTALLVPPGHEALTEVLVHEQPLMVSVPEQAALEVCHFVPQHISFDEAVLLIEGLTNLRPKVLQPLLTQLASVKAKRLLLCLSEHFQHPWMSQLNFDAVDLGQGNRVIAGGGQYHRKYQLATPALIDRNEDGSIRR